MKFDHDSWKSHFDSWKLGPKSHWLIGPWFQTVLKALPLYITKFELNEQYFPDGIEYLAIQS